MPPDPRTVVRSSNQLWSEQVGIIEAEAAMDSIGPGAAGLQALAEKRQPAIYEFGLHRRKFVQPLNPYA